MNAEDFVNAVRSFALETADADVASLLESPPGRRPRRDLVELSVWYKNLSDSDRAMLRRVMREVSHAAVFGVFAILDGSRRVDPAWAQGDHFELRHVHGDEIEVLSGPQGAVLHELL